MSIPAFCQEYSLVFGVGAMFPILAQHSLGGSGFAQQSAQTAGLLGRRLPFWAGLLAVVLLAMVGLSLKVISKRAACNQISLLGAAWIWHKGSLAYYKWFAFQFWRFVYVQQEVGKLAQSALEFPPMQKGASFNLEVIKEQLAKKMAAQNQ